MLAIDSGCEPESLPIAALCRLGTARRCPLRINAYETRSVSRLVAGMADGNLRG